jgi:hypothetical protein
VSIAPVSSSAAGAVLNPFGLPRFPQTLKSRSNQIRHARYVGTNYDMGDRWVNRYRYDLLVIISDGERLETLLVPPEQKPTRWYFRASGVRSNEEHPPIGYLLIWSQCTCVSLLFFSCSITIV